MTLHLKSGRKEMEIALLLAFFLLLVQDSSSWADVTLIQDGYSVSAKCFWKYSQIFPGVCFLGHFKCYQVDKTTYHR